MIKTIKIGEKDVVLKADATLMLRYKQTFGKDLFSEQAKMQKCIIKDENGNNVGFDWENFDSTVILQMAWAMAQSYDNSIPDIMTWLSQFDYFSPFVIYKDVAELLSANMKIDRKND